MTKKVGLTRPPRQDCICDTGATVVATFKRDGSVSVRVEHWAYCPQPAVELDAEKYRRTGEKVPR